MNGQRAGFALLAVIAALAVIEIAVLGALLLCMQAEASARDSADLARTRAGAEAAVRAALANWDESVMRGVPAGMSVGVSAGMGSLPGGITYSVVAERIRSGVWLLRGEGTRLSGRGARARARANVLLTAVPLAEFVADFYAPLVSGGVTDLRPGTVIDATRAAAVPVPWSPADCTVAQNAQPAAVRPALALGTAASLNSAAALSGTPPILFRAPRADSASFERLGPLLWPEVAAIADRIENGTLNLAPASAGTCDTSAAGNWGAPADPAHPCFDYFPLIFAPGSLTITAGHGQGILVVDGRLTLAPGTGFTGAILARHLDADQAEITGSVRVQNSARLSAALLHNDCAILRALWRSPALRKLYRYSNRWWLPGFD